MRAETARAIYASTVTRASPVPSRTACTPDQAAPVPGRVLIAAWASMPSAPSSTCATSTGGRVRSSRRRSRPGEEGLIPEGFVELRRGAGAYICGEESAMIESIEGNRGLRAIAATWRRSGSSTADARAQRRDGLLDAGNPRESVRHGSQASARRPQGRALYSGRGA